MRAMVIEAFGSPDVFKEKEMPYPSLRPGHVILSVRGTTANPVDCKIRQGKEMPPVFPAILHGDVAGVVVEVGAGVSRFKKGDEVYGCAGGLGGYQGALAEYMLADASLLAHKPKSLTMKEAGVLPLVTITAWEALILRAQIREGQTVLVHAGTGGVGHIGVQLAKWKKAKVFATVSSDEKGEVARCLGADVVINYKKEAPADYIARCTGGAGFDVVFDTIGGGNLDASIQAVAPYGQVVSILAAGEHALFPLFLKNGTLHTVFMPYPLLSGQRRAVHGALLEEAAQLVDQKLLRPLLDEEEYTFATVQGAHARVESGQAIGKVAIASF